MRQKVEKQWHGKENTKRHRMRFLNMSLKKRKHVT